MAGHPSDSRAEELFRRQAQLEAGRAGYEACWADIARRVLPRQGSFGAGRDWAGAGAADTLFDSTAPLALERFAAAMESMLTPRTQRWHELKPPEELAHDEAVRRYLHEVTGLLFRARYAPGANFASQAHETYMSLGAFGSGAIFVDDHLGRGLRYRAVPLSELYFCENFQGVVDTVHRRFALTARQAVQQFGRDDLPEPIRAAAEREPERRFDFLHCVQPREHADWSRRDWRGMAWASRYVSLEGRALLREGGYRTLRYAVSRYVSAPREVYGRSPAMTVLADIRTLNEMQRTLLRTGQLVAEPPILLADDGVLGAFQLKPGGLNLGALNQDGAALARPFPVGADLPITLEMVERQRKVVNDAFLVSLFQILVEQPQMTATEAMLRAQEKGALLAPTMGRQQSEMLGPLIQAELDILGQAGVLPAAPDALRAWGGDVAIEYVSPLTRAQRADEGVGILRTVEQAAALAQFDPDALLALRADEIVRELGEINGMPAKLLRTPAEVEAMKAARAEVEQLRQALAAAPVVAGAAREMAQAQALAATGSGAALATGGGA